MSLSSRWSVLLAPLLPVAANAQPIALRPQAQPVSVAVPAPQRSPSSLSATTADGASWIVTPQALLRTYQGKTQHLPAQRFLPPGQVLSLVADGNAVIAVSAEGKARRISFDNWTLERKAAYFEDRVQKRHNRHGMVADSHLGAPGDLSSNQLVSNDNDGLWTAMYGAAECYRYAVTKSPEALAYAKRSVEAVLFLEQITGRPGFPARSYIKKNEPKPKDGFWYKTPSGEMEWKADTSSDEIVGHFYLFSVAFDLLPDPDLKKRIAATARRIMDHILSNGYYLMDVTGKPTRWGKWSTAYFESAEGRPDAPLNALEILGFLRATQHFTGDPKYGAEYRKAAVDLGYAAITARYIEWMEELNYSDEELAYLSFYTLFRYEKDPKFLPIYRDAIGQWWKNMHRENNPLWMLIYQYCMGSSVKLDMRPAVQTLFDIPLDLVKWTVVNSHREDIRWAAKKDRFGRREALDLLPAYERPVMKWNGNPFVVDGGSDGRAEDDGGFFLLPYWMGRYVKAWTE